jgi:streptogramin lyase
MRACFEGKREISLQITVGTVVIASLAAFADAQSITEFAIPPSMSNPPITNPFGIAAGPDGNVWFTENYAKNIGRITPAGTITEFPAGAPQLGITPGPDGALWFTGGATGIGRITTAGAVTGFTGAGQFITNGPDGALWLTTNRGVRRVLPSSPNTFVEYPTVLPVSTCAGVTSGPDGNIWFTETDHNHLSVRVARIDLTKLNGCDSNPALCITEFVVPGGIDVGYTGIVSGPDGAVWFTDKGKVGRITTAGVVTQFPAANATPQGGITKGPDGVLWYAGTNKIGRITTAGVVTEIVIPSLANSPYQELRQITAGPDGNIWFVEISAQKIGRVNLGGAVPTPTPTLSVTPTRTPTGTSSGQARGHVTPIRPPTPKSNIEGRN